MMLDREAEQIRGELRKDIACSKSAEANRESLVGMGKIIEPSGEIGHANIASSRETSEVGNSQAGMSIVRPVGEREGKSMTSSLEEVGARRRMIAKVLMQGRADCEPARLEGGRGSQLIAVISAKRLGALPPSGRIVIGRVGHAESCGKRRHEQGTRTNGSNGICHEPVVEGLRYQWTRSHPWRK